MGTGDIRLGVTEPCDGLATHPEGKGGGWITMLQVASC